MSFKKSFLIEDGLSVNPRLTYLTKDSGFMRVRGMATIRELRGHIDLKTLL